MAKTRDELGYCGTDCEECNIYRAMMFGEALKPETIKTWQEHAIEYWGIDSLDPEQMNCRGCRYEGEDVFPGFRTCPVRGCCKIRGLSSCGLCSEWKKCKWEVVEEYRENLERIDGTE